MDVNGAVKAFRAMVEASKAAEHPVEIRLVARPVVDAQHPGDTVRVKDLKLPEGTVPTEPDSLALELHVAAPAGQPVGGEVLGLAAEHGLSVGTSDLLLL